MPTLQVRDLPEEIYAKLAYLAEKEHRSLAQEAIVLLKEGIDSRMGNKERRAKTLTRISMLQLKGRDLPDPISLIREDRDR